MTLRRALLILAGACAAVAIVGVIWVVVTGLLARAQLMAARAEISDLRNALSAGDVPRAELIAARLADHTRSADDLTSGPAWWVAANLPVVGDPLRTVRVVATQADRLGSGPLPALVQVGATLRSRALRNGSTIDLSPLQKAVPAFDSASRVTGAVLSEIRGSPSSTWLSSVDDARASVLSQLAKLSGDLSTARRAVTTLLPMLGAKRPQRYFVGFENEAEARALGGIAGAFAIVTADHGHLAFTHFGTDADLAHVDAHLNLGPEYQARYGRDRPTSVFQNSDVSPDFPEAAQIWAGMWFTKSGEHIDGAIAIDPTALSYLLAVTGPTSLPDGTQVSADDIVALTQRTQYERFRGTDPATTVKRKAFLVSISKAVSGQVLRGSATTAFLRAADRAGRERRLLIWSADPVIEKNLRQAGVSGELDAGGRPFSGFVVTNGAGSKLDTYLDRYLTYRRDGCGAASTATASFTMVNTATSTGLPPYVTVILGKRPKSAILGTNKLIVTYYATPGSTVTSFVLDGRRRTIATETEHRLTVAELTLYLHPGESRTITVTTTEPAAHASTQILRQPLVRPLDVLERGSDCGRSG